MRDNTIRSLPTRIPALNGLRAISIALVIISHLATATVATRAGWWARLGDLGVTVFFGISGFLITTLLLREEAASGSVSIANFYGRRALRILPAYYAFLLTVTFLAMGNIVAVSGKDIAIAATFLTNYFGRGGQAFEVAHAWSLAVEEQFYLIWPILFVRLGNNAKRWKVVLGAIVAGPFIRVLTHVLLPSRRGWDGIMFHTRMDSLLFGCIVALLWREQFGRALVAKSIRWKAHVVAIAVLLFISPWMAKEYGGPYILLVQRTVEGASVALVIAWTVAQRRTLASKLLNNPLADYMGALSYSLYLWQQLFTHTQLSLIGRLLATYAAAALSYALIEKPMFRFRSQRLGAWQRQPEPTKAHDALKHVAPQAVLPDRA